DKNFRDSWFSSFTDVEPYIKKQKTDSLGKEKRNINLVQTLTITTLNRQSRTRAPPGLTVFLNSM
ncbi:unnamed protein product, partial [Bubo scandiacus]